MNTITFIAFLLGINGTTPATPAPERPNNPGTVKETTKPTTASGVTKGGMAGEGEGRGGWDRN